MSLQELESLASLAVELAQSAWLDDDFESVDPEFAVQLASLIDKEK